jgi:hypothetical protein
MKSSTACKHSQLLQKIQVFSQALFVENKTNRQNLASRGILTGHDFFGRYRERQHARQAHDHFCCQLRKIFFGIQADLRIIEPRRLN